MPRRPVDEHHDDGPSLLERWSLALFERVYGPLLTLLVLAIAATVTAQVVIFLHR